MRAFILPSFFACLLINGDKDGLTNEQINDLRGFLSQNNLDLDSYCVDSVEVGYSRNNDLYNYPTECMEFVLV